MPNSVTQQYIDLVNSTPYLQSIARNGKRIVEVEQYTYLLSIGSASAGGANILLSGGTFRGIVTTQGDSDFVVETLAVELAAATATDVFSVYGRNVTLQIQDLKTGKFLYSQPTIYSLLGGAGGMPFTFFTPHVMPPNTVLQATIQNRDQNNYAAFFCAFQGFKVFYA